MISQESLAVEATAIPSGTVNVSVQVAAPLEKVWQSLTEADVVAQWFGRLDKDLSSGSKARLDFGDGDFFDLDSVVLSPPDQIQYDWKFLGIGPCDSITWRIEPNEGGCLVTVTDMQPERSPEAVAMLREGWLDFTSRLVDFHATGKNARYDWRRELDVGLPIPGAAQDVWQSLFAPESQTSWLPFDAILESGTTVSVIDRAMPRRLKVVSVKWQAGHQVEFELTSDKWKEPTICRIELTAREDDTLVYVSHNGWENISDNPSEQLRQRKRFCTLWIDALKRASQAAEASSWTSG